MFSSYLSHIFPQQTAVYNAYQHVVKNDAEEWITKMADKKIE